MRRCGQQMPFRAARSVPLMVCSLISPRDAACPRHHAAPAPAQLSAKPTRWVHRRCIVYDPPVQGRPPAHPDHDPTTLLISPAAWQHDLKGADAQ